MMKKIILRSIVLAAAVCAFKCINIYAVDFSIGSLSINWNDKAGWNELSWDSVESSGTLTYYVYRSSGYVSSAALLSTVSVGNTKNTTFVDKFTDNGNIPHYGTYSYIIRAVDTIYGTTNSPVQYSELIYDTERGDANGSQVGYDQTWHYNFKLQGDVEIYAAMYPAGTTFTYNSVNIIETLPITTPTQVICDYVPFSDTQGVEWVNEVTWTTRDSNGKIFPNGLYYLLLQARDKLTNTIRDSVVGTIPVDTIRFLSLSVESITAVNPVAKLNYDINASAKITFLICQPGTKFRSATASGSLTYLTNYTYEYEALDVLPLNPDTLAVDGSRILKVIQVYRKYGENSEEWDGLDEAGTALDNNVYALALFAKDDYSNHSFDTSNNDYFISDTLAIDTTFIETGGGTTTDTTRPTVISYTPEGGSTCTTVVTQVSADVTDGLYGSGVDAAASSIVLEDSSGVTISGTQSYEVISSTVTRLIYTLSSPLTRSNNGNYTISVVPVDISANGVGGVPYEAAFTVSIEDPNVFSQGVEIYSYPNPAKNTSFATFAFTLNRAATMRLRIFNILGELIKDTAFQAVSGANTYIWDLKNDSGDKIVSGVYIYKLEADDGGAKQEVVKKLIVIK